MPLERRLGWSRRPWRLSEAAAAAAGARPAGDEAEATAAAIAERASVKCEASWPASREEEAMLPAAVAPGAEEEPGPVWDAALPPGCRIKAPGRVGQGTGNATTGSTATGQRRLAAQDKRSVLVGRDEWVQQVCTSTSASTSWPVAVSSEVAWGPGLGLHEGSWATESEIEMGGREWIMRKDARAEMWITAGRGNTQ